MLISASTNVYKEIIISAAKKGKHIFCEKPIALTLEETNEALAAVEKAKVLMQVGFMRRFDPTLFSAKQEVDKGSIGKPLVFKAVSRDPEGPPLEYARVSGGLFVDCVMNNKTSLVTGVDGKKALEIALAATKSCQKGIPISLESQ